MKFLSVPLKRGAVLAQPTWMEHAPTGADGGGTLEQANGALTHLEDSRVPTL